MSSGTDEKCGVINRLLIDGHVHVHDSYDESAFLRAAYTNLSRHGEGLPTLLLTEMPGQQVFAKWRSGDAPWPVALTRELSSVVLGDRLLVVAGRQIIDGGADRSACSRLY